MRKNNWKLATTTGWALAFVVLSMVLITQAAQAQTFNVIYNFTGGQDGANPRSALTMSAGGTLYGTTIAGGNGYGGVFALNRSGSGSNLIPLHVFTGALMVVNR